MSKVTFCIVTILMTYISQLVLAGDDYSRERFFYSPDERVLIERARLSEASQSEAIEADFVKEDTIQVVVEPTEKSTVKSMVNPAPVSIDGVVIRHQYKGTTLIKWLDGTPQAPARWNKTNTKPHISTAQVVRSTPPGSLRTEPVPAGQVIVVRSLR